MTTFETNTDDQGQTDLIASLVQRKKWSLLDINDNSINGDSVNGLWQLLMTLSNMMNPDPSLIFKNGSRWKVILTIERLMNLRG